MLYRNKLPLSEERPAIDGKRHQECKKLTVKICVLVPFDVGQGIFVNNFTTDQEYPLKIYRPLVIGEN